MPDSTTAPVSPSIPSDEQMERWRREDEQRRIEEEEAEAIASRAADANLRATLSEIAQDAVDAAVTGVDARTRRARLASHQGMPEEASTRRPWMILKIGEAQPMMLPQARAMEILRLLDCVTVLPGFGRYGSEKLRAGMETLPASALKIETTTVPTDMVDHLVPPF